MQSRGADLLYHECSRGEQPPVRQTERKDRMTDSQTNTVLVYVRLCGDDPNRECREISFKIPDKLPQKDLLDEGFAIDGNSASKSIVSFVTGDGVYVPLSEALLDFQRDLATSQGNELRAILDYNKSLSNLARNKATTLERYSLRLE